MRLVYIAICLTRTEIKYLFFSDKNIIVVKIFKNTFLVSDKNQLPIFFIGLFYEREEN